MVGTLVPLRLRQSEPRGRAHPARPGLPARVLRARWAARVGPSGTSAHHAAFEAPSVPP